MLTRMMITTAIIGALAVGAHTSGMVDLKKVPKELGLSASEPRYIIVAADITAGREGELQKDFEAVQKLIDTARLGEKIEVYLIHSRAEASQEAIFTAEMPSDEGPMGTAFKRAQTKAKLSFQDNWNKGIDAALGDRRLVQQTDLFGFFRFVSQKQEFRRSRRPVLVLLTDGQQVGDGFNFERTIPIERDLKRAKNAELMPDLTGVTVTMSGVTPTHNISNLHWRKLQSWWQAYLKEAGAELAAISSERSGLSEI